MDLVPDELAEALVHELVTGDRALALEFRRHDQRLEVRVVIACHDDVSVSKTGFD